MNSAATRLRGSAGACADALSPEATAAFVADMAADNFLLIQGNLSRAATLGRGAWPGGVEHRPNALGLCLPPAAL